MFAVLRGTNQLFILYFFLLMLLLFETGSLCIVMVVLELIV